MGMEVHSALFSLKHSMLPAAPENYNSMHGVRSVREKEVLAQVYLVTNVFTKGSTIHA